MTDTQRRLAVSEAVNYTDADAFVSDMLLSSAFLPGDETEAAPDLTQAEELRRLWMVVAAPFRQLLGELGMTQSSCARRWCIPLRTVQGWALGETRCPVYVRLMMAEICGVNKA